VRKRPALLLLALLLLPLLLPALPAGAAEQPSVTIGFLPTVTREPEIMVRGSAPAGSLVALSVNGELVLRVYANATMAVYWGAVPLQPGHNTITAQVDDTPAKAVAHIYRVTATFDDLADDPLRDDIEILATLGILSGNGSGKFQPHKGLTRAELAKILVLAVGMSPAPASAPLSATDQASIPDWTRPYVAAAFQSGLLKGYADGTFQPHRPVTRAELIALAARLIPAGAPLTEAEPFADQAEIPEWVAPSATLAAQAGLIDSFWGDRFQANTPATRGETAAVFRRLIDLRRPANP